MTEVPFVDSVFHPTDFSGASEHAFAHALAIAVKNRARLDILHAGASLMEDWERFPGVRQTLERWGLLPRGSERSAVFERLGVAVKKREPGGNPGRACLHAIREIDPGLVVLATEGRSGIARWLRPSVAEAIAHRTHAATLFVPAHGPGIVSLDTGAIDLKRILVPIADRPLPDLAVTRAEQLARLCSEGPVTITILQVNGAATPSVFPEAKSGVIWVQDSAKGNVVEKIVRAARSADLIVMPTKGTHGVWDALRGGTTSEILRSIESPLLAVPAG